MIVLAACIALVVGLGAGAGAERYLFRRKHSRAISALGRMIGGPKGRVIYSYQHPSGKGEADILNLIPPEDRTSLMDLWRDAR